MTKPKAENIIVTRRVFEKTIDDNDIRNKLIDLVVFEWEKQPENDKRFFVINYDGRFDLWVVYTDYTIANEEDPENYPMREVYTVMFPEEY